MTISLSIENIINDISGRYLMQKQGTDTMPPKGVLTQSIAEANAKLVVLVSKYIQPSLNEYASDNLVAMDLVYDLVMTQRRAMNKIQALTDLMHSFLVNAALAKIYSNEAQQELSKNANEQAVSDANNITYLLNTKYAPR